jgi:hypothetical protein
MIKKLSVKNFKSIKELEIDCRRINLFIGEPNTGKSNILEALGLLSWCAHGRDVPLKDYVRFQETQNLFYDNWFDETVEIRIENGVEIAMKMQFEDDSFPLHLMVPFDNGEHAVTETGILFTIGLEFEYDLESRIISAEVLREFENNEILLSISGGLTFSKEMDGTFLITDGGHTYFVRKEGNKLNVYETGGTFRRLDHSGLASFGTKRLALDLAFIKYYTFERQDNFQERQLSFLMPPHGSNMFAVVMGSRKLRASMARFFNDLGFRLVLRPQAKTFESQKQIEDADIDVVFSYPYISISDTLQRIIFHTLAIESSKNSTLVFEEPEAHAFPEYTVYLGKKIAFDETNQYFIATHNPYFLLSILEKAPKDDVNVFVTYLRDYQTKVKCLNDEEKSELMVYDPFGNLDQFIESVDSFIEAEEQ